MADWYVNGLALSALGLYLEDAGDSRSLAPAKYPLTPLYKRAGAVGGVLPEVGPRVLTLRGKLVTSANTVTARVQAEDMVKDWLANAGLLTIELRDDIAPAREIDGYVEQLTIQPFGHPLLAVAATVDCRIVCPEAYWRAPQGTLVHTPGAWLPLGTAPSTPLLRIHGPSTNPSFSVYDLANTVRASVSFTVTLTSSEYLDVDCATGVITKVSSGTRTNGISLLTSGTFPFVLDPAWGHPYRRNVAEGLTSQVRYSASDTMQLFFVRRYA